jgi:hypothetical protein
MRAAASPPAPKLSPPEWRFQKLLIVYAFHGGIVPSCSLESVNLSPIVNDILVTIGSTRGIPESRWEIAAWHQFIQPLAAAAPAAYPVQTLLA